MNANSQAKMTFLSSSNSLQTTVVYESRTLIYYNSILQRTGMINVDAKFYFASRIFCPLFRQIEPPPPDIAPPFYSERYK